MDKNQESSGKTKYNSNESQPIRPWPRFARPGPIIQIHRWSSRALNSDSSGQLRFSDTSGSTSAVVYSVDLAPANAATIVPVQVTTANTLKLRWFAPST